MAFQVEFVSPETILYSGEGTQVIARTRGGGEIAFLAGHEPFIGSLTTSEVRVTEDGGNVQSFCVRGGFVSVTGTKVTVLSDQAVPTSGLNRADVETELAVAEAALAADADDAFAAQDKAWANLRLGLLSGGTATAAAH
jgi:F-type H+-transporting ATPase subunit epsilon